MNGQGKLKQLRRYHGLTQSYMAELIEVDVRTYISKEKGASQFKLDEMFIISHKFGLSIEEIFLPPNIMNHDIEKGEGEFAAVKR